jgi:NADPH-dependent ferric siderophore reductase
MLIESKIKREGGSHIDIAGVDWHFKPQADGAHVCDVTDEDAIAVLLAIPAGFRLVGAQADAAPESAMVLIGDDEQRIDLMTLNKPKLLEFAKGKFKVDAMASAQAIRESIYKQAKS